MSLKPSRTFQERIREKLRKKELEQTGGTPEPASFHRRAYHREFEGYCESKRENGDGSFSIARVYIGCYYRPEESKKVSVLRRILIPVFFVSSCILFFFAASSSDPANYVKTVSVFEACSVAAFLYTGYVVFFCFLPENPPYTVPAYKSVHRPLISGCLLSFFFCLAAGILSLVSDLFAGIFSFSFVPFTASALLSLFSGLWEMKRKYEVLPPKEDAPADSFPISLNDSSPL